MCARRVDGLIIIPTPGSHDYLVSEIEAGVAAVFVLRPPALVRADAVLPDERGGGRAAVAHLIAHGHRRIGLVSGDPGGYRTKQLLAGYTEAMTAAGLPADPAWTALTAQSLPGAQVTAVLCADRAQTEAVLRVDVEPGRLAVVGFGDFPLADLMSPPVTVLSYDALLIGRTAGELLIGRLAGEQAPPRTVQAPVQLIERGSAEFPPAER
jgi:LacI family transcriptional regulator